MNTQDIRRSSNPILAGVLPALRRAAKRAKRIAQQTGTRLIVVEKKATRSASKGPGKP